MRSRLMDIKARSSARTRGRWAWVVRSDEQTAALVALHDGAERMVLDFTRWGSKGAAARFTCDGEPVRIDKLHREGQVDHPDAVFMAHAPGDIEWLIAEVERLRDLADQRLLLLLLQRGYSIGAVLRQWWRSP